MPAQAERDGHQLAPAENKALPRIDGDFADKHIVSLDQFDTVSLERLFALTGQMRDIARNARPSDILSGNIAVLLFYEPSSRTRGSFDAAAKQLGGQTIVVENPQAFSSVSKGETLEDTIQTFGAYSDTIIIRHGDVGTAQRASEVSPVSIINAGDGIGEHPTQALLDLYTIKEHSGRLSGLTGVMAGDIKNGRTVHSLLRGLSLYPNNSLFLLSPPSLKLDSGLRDDLTGRGLHITEIEDPQQIPRTADFWYWTRVQKERFEDPAEYKAVNNRYVVDNQFLDRYGNNQMILMHPLPRVGEISPEVDNDPRSVYLRQQVRNGMYIRMALLSLVLGK